MYYNYREGKERYIPNKLGSLYVNKSKLNDNERPVIYIGGQMEHRCHVLEQSGKTADPGHNMFTGNWFYDYSVLTRDKLEINGEHFAENLKLSLERADLYDVDLITHSFGGIIASLASNSNRIHKIYAVHPPITGTPLANPTYFDKYKELLTKHEKLLLRVLKLIVNTNYGFEHDSFTGVDLNKVDLNKLIVIGSNINPETETGLPFDLYNMIKKVTGLENDGVVTFDEDTFNKLGINYVKEDGNFNHFISGTEEAFNNAYQLSRKL